MNLSDMITAARKDKPADLLLRNARVINVFSGQIMAADIAISGGYIVGWGDYPAHRERDLKGRFVCPGFIDAHVHIESAMVSVGEFCRAVLPCGTTTVVADPHEIANVLGAEGIRYMLRSAEDQPMNVCYALPSCVPATEMETAGAALGADALAPFMGEDRILALAELMNYPGVIYGNPDVLKKIELAKAHRKPVDGHAPGLTDADLNAYLAAGIASDHECTTADEAREKLDRGMFIMVREGTGAQNLEALFPAINERTCHRMMWCTDDRHPHDILGQGHLDHVVRKAIGLGLDPVTAIQMGTLNPARYFSIRDAGAVAPGYRADLIVFSDLNAPRAEAVYAKGVCVAEDGEMVPEVGQPAAVAVPSAMNLSPEAVDFAIPAQGGQVRVIEMIPRQITTRQHIMKPGLAEGLAVADSSRDLLKLAVTERYTGKGGTGLGFVAGLGLRRGALASSVAHDSHNIIVAGTDDADMKAALTAVVRMGGGMAVACDGQIRSALPLPIAGLMSPDPMPVIRDQLDHLIGAARDLGTGLHDPFMTLGFLALPVIPELRLTDKGLVDVTQFKVVPLFTDG